MKSSTARGLRINPQDDIAALAAYAPRTEAIRMILEGRIEEYLAWVHGDGAVAAWGQGFDPRRHHIDEISDMPLDRALRGRIESSTEKLKFPKGYELEKALMLRAFQCIPCFQMSLLEMVVRRANLTTLKQVLAVVNSPQRRFHRGYRGDSGQGWTSWPERYLINRNVLAPRQDLPLTDLSRKQPLQLLALLLGNFEAADCLQRSGWGENDYWSISEMWQSVAAARKAIAEDPAAEPFYCNVFDIPQGTFDGAIAWLQERHSLGEKLEDLFGESDYAAVRQRAFDMLAKGAPVGYYALADATEHNDLEMLRLMFAGGGDPNCCYKTGMSMLARINDDKLTPEALQIWLDAGANPTHGESSEEPYGNGLNPSALYQWTWKGRLDLVRQAVERSAAPVPLSFVVRGQTYAPLLALALSRGHCELAVWMIRDQGLSLDQRGYAEDDTCSEFAKADLLAQVKAALATGA